MTQHVEYSISTRSLGVFVVSGAAMILLWRAREVFLLFLTALLLAATVIPLVQRLQRWLPLSLAALIVVVGLSFPMIFVAVVIVPSLAAQVPNLIQTMGASVRSATLLPVVVGTVNVAQSIQAGGYYIVSTVTHIARLIITAIALVALTYGVIVDLEGVQRFCFAFVPPQYTGEVTEVLKDFAHISGQYIRGNFLISLICSTTIFFGLLILRVPYPGQLAVLAGILDLLPLVGAVVVAVPAAMLGLLVSPLTSVLVVLFFVVYQEAENHILVPNIYNKALHLQPVSVLIAVMTGATLFGIAGAFLALPIAAGIPVFTQHSMGGKLFA